MMNKINNNQGAIITSLDRKADSPETNTILTYYVPLKLDKYIPVHTVTRNTTVIK